MFKMIWEGLMNKDSYILNLLMRTISIKFKILKKSFGKGSFSNHTSNSYLANFNFCKDLPTNTLRLSNNLYFQLGWEISKKQNSI